MDTVQVDQENLIECRVVVAGDKGVGKSMLVEKFLHGDVSQDVCNEAHPVPIIMHTTIGHRTVKFNIQEISNISETEVSPTLYESDVILLCFNISQSSTLHSLTTHWVPSLTLLAPSIPLLLIGCQADQRTNTGVLISLSSQGKSPVSSWQALKASRQIGAVMYVETETKNSSKSAATAFEVAAMTCMGHFNIPPMAAAKERSRSVTMRNQMESSSEFWGKFGSPIPKKRWSKKSAGGLKESIQSVSLSNLSLIRSKSSPLSDTNVLSANTSSKHQRVSRKTSNNEQPAKLKLIRCQRLTGDKTFEEIEIAVPESVYDNLEPEGGKVRNTDLRKSFRHKLKSLFFKDLST